MKAKWLGVVQSLGSDWSKKKQPIEVEMEPGDDFSPAAIMKCALDFMNQDLPSLSRHKKVVLREMLAIDCGYLGYEYQALLLGSWIGTPEEDKR